MAAAEEIHARIRRDGPVEMTAEQLVKRFGVERPKPRDLQRIAAELEAAGVLVEPAVTAVREPGVRVTLSSAHVQEPEPEPELKPEAPPRSARPSARTRLAGVGGRLQHARAERSAAAARRREASPARPADAPPPPSARAVPLPDLDTIYRPLLIVASVVTFATLFLPWFEAERGGSAIPDLSSGWQWFGILDVFVLLVVLGGVALAAAPASLQDDQRTWFGRVVLGLAVAAMLLVIVRLVSPPGDLLDGLAYNVDRQAGGYLCLLALAGIVIAATAVAIPGEASEPRALGTQDSRPESPSSA